MSDRATLRKQVEDRLKLGGLNVADVPPEQIEAEVDTLEKEVLASEQTKPAAPPVAPIRKPSSVETGSIGGTSSVPEAAANVNTPGDISKQPPGTTDKSFMDLVTTAQRSAAKPSDSGIRDAMAKYEEASAKLKDRNVDTSDIDQQISDARAMYKSKADRNEWLELAQLIGRGLINLGAYAEGTKTGRLIAPGSETPMIDYGKRTDRAAEEFGREASLAEKSRQHRIDQAREQRLGDQESLQPMKEGVRAAEDKYKSDISVYNNTLDNIVRAGVEEERNRRSLESDAKRGDAEATRQLMQERRLEVQAALADNKEAASEMKQLSMQSDSSAQYIAAILADRPKDAARLAPKSAVTEDEIAAAREQAEKEVDPGLWTSKEEEAQIAAKTQATLLSKIQNKVSELRARKAVNDQRIRTGSTASSAAEQIGKQTQPETATKTATKEQLQAYMSQYKMDEQSARQYLQQQGYTVE